ncbi:RrF2 family transcriptional regulator [Acetobacterium carbinolicum]|uniref:RrF2 family transcriptional regulator n=1 Tax=Acetobacterium TaxID=33951 RepID=UPI0013A69A48|nr:MULTISPECIES: Rrf2 family transcriptional regulator [unclassified Acetobacterium]MDK2941289.1 Rrf2 family transcriptional regulator, cysteine metabolism repressor [Acetobacterium sp.]MDZ5726505.1 Rrf2 family transcriptional regulator [Acetobacterium sp. K1/6]
MRLSTKGRYGVLAMVELALQYGDGPVSIKEIAEKQSFSDSYMEQLFSSLKNAGLVKSIRGARGGYVLARDPSAITVGEIIRALEGPIELAECIDGGGRQVCAKSPECVTRGLWKDISDSISNIIDNRSLQDLLSK